MRRWIGIALLAACGGHGAARPDAPPPDAPPADAAPDAAIYGAPITGTLISLESRNDATGAPVTIAGAPDPTAVKLAVRRGDGSTGAVPLAADGTFAFRLAQAGDPYRLELDVTGQVPREFDASSPTIELALVGAGRVPRAPLHTEVQISASFGNWLDGDVAVLQTTGLWTSTSQEFAMTPNPGSDEPWTFGWEWSDADSLSGGLGLIDASQHDVLAITEWHQTGSGAGLYEAVTGALVHDDLVMVDGSDIDFGIVDTPVDITPLPARCAHVVSPRATELARVAAALPDTYNSSTDEWDLLVPAGSGLGPTAALPLATSSERVPPLGPPTDADLVAQFGDPFGGDQLLVETTAHELREIHADPSDFGAFVNLGTQTFAELPLPADCAGSAALAETAPAVAIAAMPSANGVALDHDGAVVAAPAGDVAVTWTDASPGVADDYAVELIALADVNDQATLTVERVVFATAPAVSFDASLFAAGGSYLIEVFERQGFPGAGSGDFATETFPFANAVTMSHAFTVDLSAGSGSASRSAPARP